MPFDPAQSDVQFAGQLSDLSVSWFQDQSHFVWNNVFPMYTTDQKTGQFIELSRSDFFRNEVEPRTGSEEPPIAGHGLTRQTYNCEVFQLAAMVDDLNRNAAAAPYDELAAKTRQLMLSHMINADALWAAEFFTSGVWTRTLVGADSSPTEPGFIQWDDAASDPIADIDEEKRTMLENTGKEPNVLVLGYQAWHALKENPTIVARYQVGPPAAGASMILNEQAIAAILGLDRIVVAKGTQTTSNKGAATAAFDFVVSQNDGLLLYAAPSPGLDVPTAGYSFVWTGVKGTGVPFPVFTGRKDFNFADWVAVMFAIDFHVVSADLGVFFDNIVA